MCPLLDSWSSSRYSIQSLTIAPSSPYFLLCGTTASDTIWSDIGTSPPYHGSSSGPARLAHSFPITSSAFPIPLAPSISSASSHRRASDPRRNEGNSLGAQNLPDMLISNLSAKPARIGAASSGSIATCQSPAEHAYGMARG